MQQQTSSFNWLDSGFDDLDCLDDWDNNIYRHPLAPSPGVQERLVDPHESDCRLGISPSFPPSLEADQDTNPFIFTPPTFVDAPTHQHATCISPHNQLQSQAGHQQTLTHNKSVFTNSRKDEFLKAETAKIPLQEGHDFFELAESYDLFLNDNLRDKITSADSLSVHTDHLFSQGGKRNSSRDSQETTDSQVHRDKKIRLNKEVEDAGDLSCTRNTYKLESNRKDTNTSDIQHFAWANLQQASENDISGNIERSPVSTESSIPIHSSFCELSVSSCSGNRVESDGYFALRASLEEDATSSSATSSLLAAAQQLNSLTSFTPEMFIGCSNEDNSLHFGVSDVSLTCQSVKDQIFVDHRTSALRHLGIPESIDKKVNLSQSVVASDQNNPAAISTLLSCQNRNDIQQLSSLLTLSHVRSSSNDSQHDTGQQSQSASLLASRSQIVKERTLSLVSNSRAGFIPTVLELNISAGSVTHSFGESHMSQFSPQLPDLKSANKDEDSCKVSPAACRALMIASSSHQSDANTYGFDVEDYILSDSVEASLRRATQEGMATGSLLPLIKQELKLTIQARRLKEGKEDIVVSFSPRPSGHLTEEEKEKKKHRQELNRIAAAQHRQRKKQLRQSTEEECHQLERNNAALRARIDDLEQEKRHVLQLMDQCEILQRQ